MPPLFISCGFCIFAFDMTSHYQEIHNLKQEIKRLRLLVVENKMQHDREIKMLKREIVQPKTDITTITQPGGKCYGLFVR